VSPTIDICGYDYIFLSTIRLKVTGKELQGFTARNKLQRIKYKALSNKKSAE
jgi:hypothetical protein